VLGVCVLGQSDGLQQQAVTRRSSTSTSQDAPCPSHPLRCLTDSLPPLGSPKVFAEERLPREQLLQ
jgi:hypothetical protein